MFLFLLKISGYCIESANVLGTWYDDWVCVQTDLFDLLIDQCVAFAGTDFPLPEKAVTGVGMRTEEGRVVGQDLLDQLDHFGDAAFGQWLGSHSFEIY